MAWWRRQHRLQDLCWVRRYMFWLAWGDDGPSDPSTDCQSVRRSRDFADDLGDGDSLRYGRYGPERCSSRDNHYMLLRSRCLPIRSVRCQSHTRVHKRHSCNWPNVQLHCVIPLCSAANLPDGSQVKSVGAAPVYSDEKARRLNTKPRRQGVRMDSADNGTVASIQGNT